MPVVALPGPRQIGKTTLALKISESSDKESAYLDLELDSDSNPRYKNVFKVLFNLKQSNHSIIVPGIPDKVLSRK